MVEAKINIRQLTDTPQFPKSTFTINGLFAGNNTILTGETVTSLNTRDAQYGLRGRKIYFDKEDDPYGTHYATIQGWYVNSGGFASITTSNWFGYAPTYQRVYDFRTYIVLPYSNQYLLGNIIASHDATSDLIEQELRVTQQVERAEKFNLETSYGSVEFHASTELKAFMNLYWYERINQKNIIFEVELFRDNIREYFGLSKVQDITLDKINDVYTFAVYDLLPFMLETIGESFSPSATPYEGSGFTLSQFLGDTLQPLASSANVDIQLGAGVNQTMDYNEYLSYNVFNEGFANTVSIRSVCEELSFAEFLTEIQKHYGAYLFYNMETKCISLYNRNKTVGEINIDNLIIEDTFEESYSEKQYKGLFISTTQPTDIGTWTGFALAYVDSDGEVQFEYGKSEDELNNLQGYLDLRQKFPEQGFSNYVFPERTAEERIFDYMELLYQTKTYRCVVNTLDISLLNKVVYQGGWYSVIRLEKDYLNEQTIIDMTQIVTNFPNPFN